MSKKWNKLYFIKRYSTSEYLSRAYVSEELAEDELNTYNPPYGIVVEIHNVEDIDGNRAIHDGKLYSVNTKTKEDVAIMTVKGKLSGDEYYTFKNHIKKSLTMTELKLLMKIKEDEETEEQS